MAVKALNFAKVKKTYLPITFDDDKGTTILVGMPTKAIMEELSQLQENIDAVGDDENNVDDLYAACAKIMSRNKTGYVVTEEYLAEVFDIEDVKIFFRAYMDYIGEVINSKN